MNVFDNNVDMTTDQLSRIEKVRSYFNITLIAIDDLIPYGKERGIMLERLQEACMWAVKGISREEIEKEKENEE